jgi:hypothetical protein
VDTNDHTDPPQADIPVVQDQLPAPVISRRGHAALAHQRIVNSRLTGDGTSDEDNVRKENFTDLNHYWRVQLSEQMPALNFAHLLISHAVDNRTAYGQTHLLAMVDVRDTLRFAAETNAPWVVKDPTAPDPNDPASFRVRPRAAAKWLLRKPKREHLVPPSLRAFLESGANTTKTPPANSRRPPGRVFKKKLKEWMLNEWLETADTPNQGTAVKAAKTKFGSGVTRAMVREVLRKIRPNLIRVGRRTKQNQM